MKKVKDTKISTKTKVEFLIVLISIILIIVFSWVELKFFGVNSYLFLIVFNLNIILLLVILFLVIRNSVKLFLDRKRGVGGSRLRTKLVMSFISLSLIPTILMFLIAVKFVQTSVDYWFRNQIENSLKIALDIGKTNYKYIQDDIKEKISKIKKIRISKNGLENLAKKNKMGLLILKKGNNEIGSIDDDWKTIWKDIKDKIDLEDVKDKKKFWTNIYSFEGSDYVIGILSLNKKSYEFIIGGIKLKYPITKKMERIVQGVYEYNQLKSLKKPLKTSLYILLGIMTLLILFGSIWFGLKLAKEISYPIQALSSGTKRIALGDLEVRIEDESEDELGTLVKSFNLMAEKLRESQKSLSEANKVLSSQNQELENRRQYMEAVLNTITSGVISLDHRLRVKTINRSALDILNIKQKEIIGKDLQEILPEEYLKDFLDLARKLEKFPHKVIQTQMNLSIYGEEKKLLLNMVSLKTHGNSQIGIIVVFEDITELDKMQRLAAWQEIARRIAHEIKNPLTPIKLSAQRLERKFSDFISDPSFKQSIQVIVRQVDHLQKLVKEFSEFAKLPEIVVDTNEILPILEELFVLYSNSYPDIEWKKNFDVNIPSFKFDSNAIKRVIINLLNNAVEAIGDQEDPCVEINSLYDKRRQVVVVEVKDNGPGLTPKELSRIFEPYFSMKKGSTGLGLTIARSIVKEHGGEIEAESREGMGTTFKITLPV